MIEFKDVTKIYPGGVKALDGVSFTIEDGEFVFIVGHSGAGKSTVVKLLMREEQVTSGRLMVNGFNLARLREGRVPYLRRTMGVVFQDFRLIPGETVYENVAFAMRAVGAPMRIVRKRVPYILNLVDLPDKAKEKAGHLSGGEQQRVALARALVNNPQLIIADEPTGNIDPALSLEIMDLLVQINMLGTTVIVVTHEKELVDRYQKRVITIKKGLVESDVTGGKYNGI